jgi:hypothetical protein
MTLRRPASPDQPNVEIQVPGRIGESFHHAQIDGDRVVLDFLPEFLGENDDILVAGVRRLLALFAVPELQVSDEAKTGSGDDDCLSVVLITGEVKRRIENALESGDKALVISAILG